MTATISSTVGGSAGYLIPLFRAAGQRYGQASPPASGADPSRRAIPVKKTSLPPFESRSLTVLLYRPSTYEAAVVSLLLAADATGAE
jgi:hypothetical protein